MRASTSGLMPPPRSLMISVSSSSLQRTATTTVDSPSDASWALVTSERSAWLIARGAARHLIEDDAAAADLLADEPRIVDPLRLAALGQVALQLLGDQGHGAERR